MMDARLIVELILACSQGVAAPTVQAVISVESAGDPLAIATNPPRDKALAAQRLDSGFDPSTDPLTRAKQLLRLLMQQGSNVDIGLMQVNSQHLKRFGLRATDLLDPCTNIRTGTRILSENYQRAQRRYPEPQRALRAALSAYNTGSMTRGIDNGYVGRVLRRAGVDSVLFETQRNLVVRSLGQTSGNRSRANPVLSPIRIDFERRMDNRTVNPRGPSVGHH